jgi:hypothetical protein
MRVVCLARWFVLTAIAFASILPARGKSSDQSGATGLANKRRA